MIKNLKKDLSVFVKIKPVQRLFFFALNTDTLMEIKKKGW